MQDMLRGWGWEREEAKRMEEEEKDIYRSLQEGRGKI